jgi:hypothetical protein
MLRVESRATIIIGLRQWNCMARHQTGGMNLYYLERVLSKPNQPIRYPSFKQLLEAQWVVSTKWAIIGKKKEQNTSPKQATGRV